MEDEDDDEDPVLVAPEDPEVEEPELPEETGEDPEVFEGPDDGVVAGVIAEFPEADTPVGSAPPPKAVMR